MLAGRVLANRFRLGDEVGRGGTCVVHSAWDVTLQEPVAVKLLAPAFAADLVALNRFLREMQIHGQCDARFVPRIHASGRDPSAGPYLVMDLLQGESLETRLSRAGVLPREVFLPIARDIGEGIEHLHSRGIVHRDLKPANVFLLDRPRDGSRVKLLDFGTIRSFGPDAFGKTVDGALVGTPSRMSPEQACGKPVDHRTDVWAFGLLVFEALVGSPAIDGSMPPAQIVLTICRSRLPVPSQLNASLDERFDAWFARSTMREPVLRYAGVAEQLDALFEALAPSRPPVSKSRTVRIGEGKLMTLPPLVRRGDADAPRHDGTASVRGGTVLDPWRRSQS